MRELKATTYNILLHPCQEPASSSTSSASQTSSGLRIYFKPIGSKAWSGTLSLGSLKSLWVLRMSDDDVLPLHGSVVEKLNKLY